MEEQFSSKDVLKLDRRVKSVSKSLEQFFPWLSKAKAHNRLVKAIKIQAAAVS